MTYKRAHVHLENAPKGSDRKIKIDKGSLTVFKENMCLMPKRTEIFLRELWVPSEPLSRKKKKKILIRYLRYICKVYSSLLQLHIFSSYSPTSINGSATKCVILMSYQTISPQASWNLTLFFVS